ncbi:MAG: hypothetical protein EBU90_00475 [Proteobacteria bacterium]|nr:hypothetical protein [Pseudomonadota bacterium]NBP12906.1 hypothetical protein [bacterium]
MSATFSIYNILSATYWKPVDFNVVGEQFDVKKTPLLLDNGMYFYLHDSLSNAVDFTFNRKTGTFLTSLFYNSYFLTNKKNPEITEELTKIESPIVNDTGNIVTFYNSNSALPNNPTVLKDTLGEIFGKNDVFTFNFVNGKVTVKNKLGNLLTANYFGTNGLVFSPQIYPPAQTQLFDYFIGDSSIILFKSDTNYTNIVAKGTNNIYVLSSVSLAKNSSLPSNAIFSFVSYKKNTINFENDVSDSFMVKYKTNPIVYNNILDVDYDFSNNNLLSQNYLGLFPVENPNVTDVDCVYDLQIHGLKNYQTPEYKYTTANPLTGYSSSVRRVYNKIYTGTNQIKGYDKLCLGFNADTKEYKFKVNQETPFYYPSTCNRVSLANSGLIEDGATAGELPFTSDRIYVYRKNYEETIPGEPQPKSITKYDNVWLCSWLSGSNLGNKIWLDRYYNAAYYTLDQALTAKAVVYNPALYPNKPFTYDVPSTIILEPGVLYKYNRTGKESSKNFLPYLDQDRNLPNGAKLLSITNWSSAVLVDDSNYHNNGLIFFNVAENLKGSYWVLDGTNHAVFPSKSSLLQKSRLTVSMWLNVDDWSNIYGDQIFGNYYDSGFGLVNEGALGAPILTITNVGSAVAYNLNYKFNKLSEIPLPANSSSEYTFIQRLPDYTYWVFDSNNKTGVKYNAINNIVGGLSSLKTRLSGIDQVEIDAYQNFYFYDNTTKSYVKTDGNGKLITQQYFALNSGYNRIEIDNKNNNVIGIYGNASVIDNYNNIWEVVGGNLYKNRQVFANIGPTQQLTCDAANNIWISHNQDTISKLNTITGLFDFSFRVGKESAAPLNPCKSQERFRYMDFVKVPKGNSQTCDKSIAYEDNIIIIDTRDNEIYTIDQTGNLLSKLDLRGILSDPSIKLDFYAKGDFTGYQYLRKFGGNVRRLSWKFKVAEPNGNNSKLLSLNYAVSALPKGWHNFTFVFDSLKGNAKYYIDSIPVDSVSFAPLKYQLYYDYRSSLLLGAATIKNTTLNDVIGIDDSYKFIGNVSELRMYSKALTNGEIEQLYFSSDFADARKDLNWNMRVGNRNFIEEVEHWYKMQLPGSKSKYFNINIHNLNIDENIKKILENSLKASISKIIPAESSLYKINWM